MSDKQNKRRWSRELQISELMTCAYAAVCAQRKNVGYFVSTDYYCCIFIFTELDILKTTRAAVKVLTDTQRPRRSIKIVVYTLSIFT